MRHFLVPAVFFFSMSICHAEVATPTYTKEEMSACLEASVARADETMTVKGLQEGCKLLLIQRTAPTEADNSATADKKTSPNQDPQLEVTPVLPKKTETAADKPPRRLLQDRLTMEALNRSNRFILTPNKRNYLLPVSYSDEPNTAPYNQQTPTFNDLNHTEAELQLSVKILLRENIFDHNGHLYLGYTNHALWQVYNRRISAPFRGADHQPELILSFTSDFEIFGFHNVVNEAMLNHQSNGQTGLLSRSWNRLMFNSVFEKDNIAFAFNPWYRLPEDDPKYLGDPRGDDNPEITRYMGNFEFSGAYKYKSDIFSLQYRNHLRGNGYGSVELSWTFPVTKTLRGYLNYFDGYGHSLIDYNYDKEVIGLGIIFTDLF